ncbi:protein RETICULATA-RELATED 3, chloroplastic-like [Prosopis cineraria]|uniref:protein RETICULATA-RELATED 3, chloroplastic-like n=1 Tax=Prosopis cineraria TaxID=364024 RepID=UPI00240EED87|nr:protein RETICULATA-RELATED 3, chloroplastic-like [Prosopis cineraria]XP_054779948.1 protein RETICULATA-RELATED 3, chloroplastic-like [Prosopis cineraria]
MAAVAQLRFSPLSGHDRSVSDRHAHLTRQVFSFASSLNIQNRSLYLINSLKICDHNFPEKLRLSYAGGDGSNGIGGGGCGGSGGSDGNFDDSSLSSEGFGILGLFLNGWRSRVAADPQFPFKVLMEELVGVSACVLGDMASRPNFGLNELDFVFSTIVVGSIMNFTLMYLLAPTMSSSSSSLPAIFASCPKSHMFEPGHYNIVNRFGTLVYKGTVFAAVGFVAGLAGTAISNGLIAMRKKMDPAFETGNKAPPTLLNALTWAIHMGGSSNLRYQTLNGLEFMLERGLPAFAFKSSVVVLRCVNNVLGGMSFVVLARLTGSQSVASEKPPDVLVAEKEGLEDGQRQEDLEINQSTSK